MVAKMAWAVSSVAPYPVNLTGRTPETFNPRLPSNPSTCIYLSGINNFKKKIRSASQ